MKTSLYFCDGKGSDKEYHLQIVETDGGYLVNYQNGRRGNALAAGTKTLAPVPLDKAEKIFATVRAKKMAGGYVPSDVESGGFQAVSEKTSSGLLPQLLNAFEFNPDTLIYSPDWFMEPKMDGKRIMASVIGGVVVASNRKGLVVPLPAETAQALSVVGDAVLDGELVGSVYYLFDVLAVNGQDCSSMGALARYAELNLLYSTTVTDRALIKRVETAVTTQEKIALRQKIMSACGEGVVYKHINALYIPGRPNSGGTQLKEKFVASASFIVCAINDVRSVGISALGGEHVIIIGNVTIPPNHDVPCVGQVIEVEYLYAFRNGCLYQPIYKGVRDDIDSDACVIAQLKYKPDVLAA